MNHSPTETHFFPHTPCDGTLALTLEENQLLVAEIKLANRLIALNCLGTLDCAPVLNQPFAEFQFNFLEFLDDLLECEVLEPDGTVDSRSKDWATTLIAAMKAINNATTASELLEISRSLGFDWNTFVIAARIPGL